MSAYEAQIDEIAGLPSAVLLLISLQGDQKDRRAGTAGIEALAADELPVAKRRFGLADRACAERL